jgi:hypothetical protein
MEEPKSELNVREACAGTVQKFDFAKRKVWVKTDKALRTFWSRKPLSLDGIKSGDPVIVRVLGDGSLSVTKP